VTQPNSNSYYSGSTGISIRILTESSNVMKFFVSGINSSPLPFPGEETGTGDDDDDDNNDGGETVVGDDDDDDETNDLDEGNGSDREVATGTDISVNLQSGQFSMFDRALGIDQDPNHISIKVSSVHEIDADGTTFVGVTPDQSGVIHSFDSLQDQIYTISHQDADGDLSDYGGLSAKRLSFRTHLESGSAKLGTVEIDTYVFAQNGTFSIGAEEEEVFSVNENDVKFNIKLSEWSFCDGSCGAQQSETSDYVDISLDISDKDGLTSVTQQARQDEGNRPLKFGLGRGDHHAALYLSRKVFHSNTATWSDMVEGFPKIESRGEQITLTCRFRKFSSSVTYDPVVTYSNTLGSGGQSASSTGSRKAEHFTLYVLMGLLCTLLLLL